MQIDHARADIQARTMTDAELQAHIEAMHNVRKANATWSHSWSVAHAYLAIYDAEVARRAGHNTERQEIDGA